MKPSILWVTDPWDTLDHPADTSLRLLEECLRQNISCSWCDVRSIRWERTGIRVDARKAVRVLPGRDSKSFVFSPVRSVSPARFDRILYRTDPPVDLAYLHPLQMLVLESQLRGSAEIISNPDVLCQGSEKLEAAFLPSLMPASLASSEWEALLTFGAHEKRTVLKPLHQAQSKGVQLLDWTTPAKQAFNKRLLETVTDGFRLPVLLQRYLPEVKRGELRLWFLNGRLLAAVRKLPKSGEFKIDMDAGGRIALADLTARDSSAAKMIGAHLRRRRVRLAAVDLIAGKITDFNFTSPGLLVEMEKLLRRNLAEEIVLSLTRPWR